MIHSAREPPTGDSRNSAGWDKYYGWGIVNAGNAYELLKSKGCEAAGGRLPNTVAGEVLSDQPLGGKDQKTNGCVEDWQCTDANLCKGEMKCNLSSNTCYSATGSAPNCDDNNPVRSYIPHCIFCFRMICLCVTHAWYSILHTHSISSSTTVYHRFVQRRQWPVRTRPQDLRGWELL